MNKTEKICISCSRTFITTNPRKKYCNLACKSEYQKKNYIPKNNYFIKCLNCSNEFRPQDKRHVFCCKQCRWDYRQINLRDDDFREFILEKFNFTCVVCGKRGTNHHIHHIIPLYAKGEDKIENLELLCESCHRIKHKITYHTWDKKNKPLCEGRYKRKEAQIGLK